MSDETTEELVARIRDVAASHDITVGIASADPFVDTRRHLSERKAAGLHAGMAFTYSNPERSTDPGKALAGARSLVVGALDYSRAEDGCPVEPPRGRVARYSWRDYYEPLRAALHEVASLLGSHGFQAKVSVDSSELVDRAAAWRAGLGWYGKNCCVIVPSHGSRFVLGSVVTDAALPGVTTRLDEHCGSCARCQSACPTDALAKPWVLDARRCLAWLLEAPGVFPREYRASLGDRIYGCDECQDACPFNRTAGRRFPAPRAEPDDEVWVSIVSMLCDDDDNLLRRFERWYVPRRDARYLRRNALVVLGNVGSEDECTVGILDRYLMDGDPLLRGHAAWAACRLGHRALAARRLAAENDAFVLEELSTADRCGP